MRIIEELKKVKDRRPFEPFHIHLADGRDLRIMHPDGVAWDVTWSRRLVAFHEHGCELVEMTDVTSIGGPHPETSPNAMG